MGKTRTSYRASNPNSEYNATSKKKEICSHDRRKRRENNRSHHADNTDLEKGPDKDNDKGKYNCCGKYFATLTGMKIHQGKVCMKKEKDVQQRGLKDRKTERETLPE